MQATYDATFMPICHGLLRRRVSRVTREFAMAIRVNPCCRRHPELTQLQRLIDAFRPD
jgi:hypothetical protein